MEKTRNQMIDLLRFILSIGIIMIHAQLFKTTSPLAYSLITMGLTRIAVPFFFVVSGYYFYQRVINHGNIKAYFMRLMKIFIIFEGIEIVTYTLPMLSMIQEYGLLAYFWKIISVGLGGVYWYIISLLLSLALLLPFWKKKKIMPMLMIGLLFYLVVMTNDSYGGLFTNTSLQSIAKIHTTLWTWPQAGLCSSLLYLSIGAWLYQKQPHIQHINIFLFFSIIALLLEAYFLQTHQAYDGNCYFSLMICVPLLFLWSFQYQELPFDTLSIGKMSLYIYMLHPIVLNCVHFLLPLGEMGLFFITVIISLCLSYMIVKRSLGECQ